MSSSNFGYMHCVVLPISKSYNTSIILEILLHIHTIIICNIISLRDKGEKDAINLGLDTLTVILKFPKKPDS